MSGSSFENNSARAGQPAEPKVDSQIREQSPGTAPEQAKLGSFSERLAEFRKQEPSSEPVSAEASPAPVKKSDRHPPFQLVFAREKGLLGQTFATCIAEPVERELVSNVNQRVGHIFINGMNADLYVLKNNLEWITSAIGQPVTAIINDQKEFAQFEWMSAVAGLISTRLGNYFEPDEIRNLNDEIRYNYANGKKTRIVAHSHGTIITSNALSRLKKQCGNAEWKKLSKTIEVMAFGAPMYHWPDGVEVRVFNHSSDAIPRMSRGISKLRSFALGLFGAAPCEGEITTVKAPILSLSHNLHIYTKSLPHFLIERHRNPKGEVNSHSLAMEVIADIREGHFSDHIPRAVIRRRLIAGDKVFARTLLAACENGKVGEYELPFYKRLRSAAAS